MKDYVNVKITGLNLLRLIDKLVEKNVCITGLKVKTNQVRFSIEEDKLPILDNVCKKEHKFYQIIYKNGFKQLISRVPYFLGTIVALILIFSYFFAYSLFVINVDVSYSSNLSYDLTPVNELLEKNGIVPGMRKSKYKISEIQNMILIGIDNVEGCEVRYNGGNLSICIYPATERYEVSTENIYSKFDGIIIEAEVYSGNLKVKKGDIVKEGDILIENDNGASGNITAKVYFTATQIYNQNRQKIIYTGNEYKVKDFCIASNFWIYGKNNCNFTTFLVEEKNYYVGKNLFLPILCKETIFKEIEIQEEIVPFESVEEEVKSSLYEEAKTKINSESEITNVTYSIVNEGDYTRIDCYIEAIVRLA